MIKRLPTWSELHRTIKAWFAMRSSSFDNTPEMLAPTHLFPVYEEGSDTAQFFVNPAIITPAIVSHWRGDRYKRKGHFTQFLKVPVEVPNYMGLCTEPGQNAWSLMDEIDWTSLRVLDLLVHVNVAGKDEFFAINTVTMSNTVFHPSPEGRGIANLNMRIMSRGGFTGSNYKSMATGEEIFSSFKAAGYEPLFNVSLAGSYNRQLGSLALVDLPGSITGLRDIKTSAIIHHGNATNDQLTLLKSVSSVSVIGVRLHQELK